MLKILKTMLALLMSLIPQIGHTMEEFDLIAPALFVDVAPVMVLDKLALPMTFTLKDYVKRRVQKNEREKYFLLPMVVKFDEGYLSMEAVCFIANEEQFKKSKNKKPDSHFNSIVNGLQDKENFSVSTLTACNFKKSDSAILFLKGLPIQDSQNTALRFIPDYVGISGAMHILHNDKDSAVYFYF